VFRLNLGRAVCSLLFLTIVASGSAVTAQTPSPEIVAHVKRAVVLITTYDSEGTPQKQGSGFFVTSERVVTNLHVIDSANRIGITTFTGQTVYADSILASDKTSDLVLLKLSKACEDIATLVLEDVAPLPGESLILVSNPAGFQWQVTLGQVGRTWDFLCSGERMQITAGVLPGSSGGPVLNQHGRVIGVAVMHFASNDNLNFAIPVNRLKALQTSSTLAVSLTPN
jgi:S1-C subfamily serine protease